MKVLSKLTRLIWPVVLLAIAALASPVAASGFSPALQARADADAAQAMIGLAAVVIPGTEEAAPELLAADTIDPSLVRFSQDSISATFKDGGSVGDLAAGLQNGTINPSDIPPIRLVNNDGTLFTLDNRRLAAFQQAGVPIPYQMATPEEAAAQAWKFTTQNGGTSIHIRGQ